MGGMPNCWRPPYTLPTGIIEFMLHGWYVITGTLGFVYAASTSALSSHILTVDRLYHINAHDIFTPSSHMRFMSHNWSAMTQRLHPQSVAEISHHSVLSGDRIRQCETSSGSRHKDTDQCLQVAISFCRHRSVPVSYLLEIGVTNW